MIKGGADVKKVKKKYTEENQSEQKIFYKKKIVEAVEKIEDVNILIKIFDFIKVWLEE